MSPILDAAAELSWFGGRGGSGGGDSGETEAGGEAEETTAVPLLQRL